MIRRVGLAPPTSKTGNSFAHAVNVTQFKPPGQETCRSYWTARDMKQTPKLVVFSEMGPHAGEYPDAIFTRKIADVRKTGRTFWLVRSHLAKPDMIQELCSVAVQQACNTLCLFLEPSSRGGAVPTKSKVAASEYSPDFSTWYPLPTGVGPVTGRITPSACALVFDRLTMRKSEVIDLWDYANFFDPQQPITIRQGASTVCAIAKDTRTHPDRMNSHLRTVIAIGRLVEPFSVWLR